MGDALTQDIRKVSKMASGLQGSEIIKLAGEIKAKIAAGESIFNFTIGDFNTEFFPIPKSLSTEIQKAYTERHTNYPAANGMLQLRSAISEQVIGKMGLDYSAEEILVAGGARPLIYAVYQALIDPDDTVIFPVPFWNNNHYTHLSRGKSVFVETTPENNFMPTANDIKEYVKEAAMIAVCSPLNPTGTVFSKKQLHSICSLIIDENHHRREKGLKPLYLLFDQIYWQLTYGAVEHHDPVSLLPEMKEYTIYIDGISKAFAATGVRVGWSFGPQIIIDKMKSILGHIGAWSPKAEQIATAHFLQNEMAVNKYLSWIKKELEDRLQGFYKGFCALKDQGFGVDAIPPQAAIYLTVQFDLKGKVRDDGTVISNTEEITSFLLDAAGLAVVPFYAFGTSRESNWYRLSVGTSDKNEIQKVMERLKLALCTLK